MARESIEERRARLTPGARWLRAERERRGWTGGELAQRLGVHQTRVSAYERMQDEPPADFARALARVFGMTELEVWRGLQKPLPREVEEDAGHRDEVLARIEKEFPGMIDAIMSGAPLPQVRRYEADTKDADATRTGESEQSA
jgi:transcriptional regulator with XRE-family HTH domain